MNTPTGWVATADPQATGRAAGKVVVTGAAQGQGAAETRLLAAKGAAVIGCDLKPPPVEDLPGVEYRQLDVSDAAGWATLAADLDARFGGVDGPVANAGVTWRARLGRHRPGGPVRVHTVNVVGTLLAFQALTPLMPAGSSVVVVGSVAAPTGHSTIACTASKWALRGLAEAASLELDPRGIRVDTVHPGYIETPMTASAAPAFPAADVAETPLGRTGSVDEVAPLILFLVGDEASFISGAEVPVDGGMTAHGGVKSISEAVRAST